MKLKNKPHCGKPPIIYWLMYLHIFILSLFLNLKLKFIKEKFKQDNTFKVAFIGVYGTNCGVSTYNEFLVNELKSKVNIHVFAEYDEKSTNDPYWVSRCWSRTEHPKKRLLKEILLYKPDVVHISHEYGFFMKAYMFTALVSYLKSKNIKVVSTMHSVYEHLDKLVQESCNDHLVVHTSGARHCLVSKGISPDKISVIPHGSMFLCENQENPELLSKLWNTWGVHTIFQPGFLFNYKGHMRIVKMLPKLKQKYPDVHYIIQGSENQFNMEEHNCLYNDLMYKAKELDVESNLTINRGFVDQSILLSYIRTASCCVLPYISHPDHDVYATSGIARLIINTETPLITSNVHLFDDIQHIVPHSKNNSELYNLISESLNQPITQDEIESRINFINDTMWNKVAEQYIECYKNILK